MVILRIFLAVLVSISLLPAEGFAHGGGLDSSGGHYNRKTGEYHYHRKNSGSPPAPASIPPKTYSQKAAPVTPVAASSISQSEKSRRINEYFRSANENVGALDCGMTIHERALDEGSKLAVRHRDGNRCVICGSTAKLEVDHRRGLQNGGTNDISNLSTLCDDCHTEKTRMDNSLRRKREKICRGQ